MIDVLVIGSGGAGLSAALEAKKNGANVLVVSKTYPTHSQTCQAQGGINAVLNTTQNDSIENYYEDTYKASHKMGNPVNIKLFCENSKNTIDWLDKIAVPFSRDEKGDISQRKFGGTKAKRTCYSSDYTGLKILHSLYDQAIKHEIEFLNEYLLLELIKNEDEISGAIFLDIKNGEIKEVFAKTTILATGGYAGIYSQNTTNSYSTTGDGIAAAFKAGVKLSNMEFIQFHPTSLEGKNILISESARGEGGYLVDEEQNRFVDELKPRDEVARAIFEKQIKNQKVFLDLRHIPLERIQEVMPQERRLINDFLKLKVENDLIPITPSAHYSMGGIFTNVSCETSLKNLFACGECAQSGIHGANRLGGNSLLEIVTFGRIAGQKAYEKSKKIDVITNSKKEQIEDEIKSLFENEETNDFYKIKKELSEYLFKDVGLFREQKGLEEVEKFLQGKEEEIKKIGIKDKSKQYNKNLVELLEFKNIYLLSRIIVSSAKERKESRGAHYRLDYKEVKEEFEKISINILENNDLKTFFEEIK